MKLLITLALLSLIVLSASKPQADSGGCVLPNGEILAGKTNERIDGVLYKCKDTKEGLQLQIQNKNGPTLPPPVVTTPAPTSAPLMCPEGWRLSPDGTECLDVMICLEFPLICGPGVKCADGPGFEFTCYCPENTYHANGVDPSDGCTGCFGDGEVVNAEMNGCVSVTTPAAPLVCPEGWRLSPDGTECLDAMICLEFPLICGPGVKCADGPGFEFTCYCPENTYHTNGVDPSDGCTGCFDGQVVNAEKNGCVLP